MEYPHKSSFVQIFLKTRFEDESRDISARSRSLRAFRLAKGSVVDPCGERIRGIRAPRCDDNGGPPSLGAAVYLR